MANTLSNKKRSGRRVIKVKQVSSKPPLSKRQLRAVKSTVNKTLNQRVEKKFHDSNNSASTPSYSGAITTINDVAAGTSDVQRVGDELRMRSLKLRYAITPGDATNMVRAIVFQWFDDTTPTLASILEITGDVLAPLSPYKHDLQYSKPKMFHVLHDKLYTVDTTTHTQVLGGCDIRRFANRRVHFTEGSSTPDNNRLMLAFISDSAAVNHPSVSYYARLSYDDM